MSNTCEICGKGVLAGNKVSHSNRKSRTSWKPNIQRVRVVVDNQVKTMNVCTSCLRSGKVTRIQATPVAAPVEAPKAEAVEAPKAEVAEAPKAEAAEAPKAEEAK
jgi:large subunit ribosomal protein L28